MSRRSRRERRRAKQANERHGRRARLENERRERDGLQVKIAQLELVARRFEVMNARVRLAQYRTLADAAAQVPRHLWPPEVERAVLIVQALARDEGRRRHLAEGRRLGLVPPLVAPGTPPETLCQKLLRFLVSTVGG